VEIVKTAADFERAELSRLEDLPSLRAALPVEDWQAQARCHGEWDLFHLPDSDRDVRPLGWSLAQEEAKRTCLMCPVITECLTDALTEKDRYGIRGATTPSERKALAALPVAEATDVLLSRPLSEILPRTKPRVRVRKASSWRNRMRKLKTDDPKAYAEHLAARRARENKPKGQAS
jgi:WhiB family redox-sensing transcriptional regulator